MSGTFRVRSYRQRKPGGRSRYSHGDLYSGGRRPGLPIQRSLLASPRLFSDLAVAFLCISGSVQRGTTAMTEQLAVGYEGTEPFPDGGSPPRTFAGAVRVTVTAVIVIVP